MVETAVKKEVDQLEEQRSAIKNLIGVYPEMSKGYPSAWIAFSDDWAHVNDNNLPTICHGAMSRHSSKVYDNIITAVPRDGEYELKYIQWLIDGPFRTFKDRIFLETFVDKKGITSYYLRCTKLDTWPANVLYNFCIATRSPIEYPWMFEAWSKMVDAGVNPAIAMLFACRSKPRSYYLAYDYGNGDPWDWKLSNFDCPYGHFWFDNTADWSTVINGEPLIQEFRKNFKDHPTSVCPANVIWGTITQDDSLKMVGKTVKELSDRFIQAKPEPALFIPDDNFKPNLEDEYGEDEFDDDDDDDDFFDDEWDPDDEEPLDD